jgi:hypothetical protein
MASTIWLSTALFFGGLTDNFDLLLWCDWIA